MSLTNSLTQTHGTFLEWVSIKDATIAGRYTLENGNAGTQPYTPAPLEADCYEIHETIGTLLATLGYPVFVPLTKTGALTKASETEERFFCRAAGANGTGLYTEEGFVVLAGSTGRIDVIPSMKDTPLERLRNRLIEGGIAGVQNGSYTFLKNHLFGSPSTAAAVLTAKTSNGWFEWRDNNNRTLDELKRQGS